MSRAKEALLAGLLGEPDAEKPKPKKREKKVRRPWSLERFEWDMRLGRSWQGRALALGHAWKAAWAMVQRLHDVGYDIDEAYLVGMEAHGMLTQLKPIPIHPETETEIDWDEIETDSDLKPIWKLIHSKTDSKLNRFENYMQSIQDSNREMMGRRLAHFHIGDINWDEPKADRATLLRKNRGKEKLYNWDEPPQWTKKRPRRAHSPLRFR